MSNIYQEEIVNKQQEALRAAESECFKIYKDEIYVDIITLPENQTQDYCPPFWDQVTCWPSTPANTLLTIECPSYFAGFDKTRNATRQCMENGLWYIDKTQNSSWTNYTDCYDNETVKVVLPVDKFDVPEIYKDYLPIVKIIAESGYVVSFTSLVIAFCIMLFIKKLHCARNILHMHLFASFMLRAAVFFLKNQLFVDNVALPSDVVIRDGHKYFNVEPDTRNWLCKLVTSIWEYFILANFSWILMEGVYLHNLIFRALFADSNTSIRWYIMLGWGLPLIILIKWIVAKILVDDKLCWNVHEHYVTTLILTIPILLSILINFILFIRISIVLYCKLKSPINEESQRYTKWIKSTLVLAPLFGVHYAIFLIIFSIPMNNNMIWEFVWLVCDMLFGSFQGCFVAVLYCFLNGEVKSELTPRIYSFFTFLATNSYSKYFFPCRKQFLRSIVGRSSVCTTLSCSSLYTNGVLPRHSKTRIDSITRTKHPTEKRDHFCHNGIAKSLQDLSSKKTNSINDLKRQAEIININIAETPLCAEMNCKCDNEINEEMLKMVDNF